MSRFVREAVRALVGMKGFPHDPRPYSGLFLATSVPSGPGHLGLVRTRPALRELNALFAPEAFLLDATYALGAAALHARPSLGRAGCPTRDAEGNAEDAEIRGIFMAVVDAKDCRFEDALGAAARLASEHPDSPNPRLLAAAFCYLLRRNDECEQWLDSLPEDASLPRPRENACFYLGLVAATLGGAPGAFAGSEDRVASAAFQLLNCRAAIDGDMSVSQIILTLFLQLGSRRTCKDPALKRNGIGIFGTVSGAFKALSGRAGTLVTGSARCGTQVSVLDASQALLSTVVLHAPPLSGERVRDAARVAELDLARAVEEGDACTAASLRLLLAFLAVRDGRFGDALERYAEVARDNPSDPWPRYLAHIVSLFVGQREECDKWKASYDSLDPGSKEERRALCTLKDELVVALALGGSPVAFNEHLPNARIAVMDAAASRVDDALVSALQDKEKSVVERLELRAVRAFLHAWAWLMLKELQGKNDDATE
ncbi:hypothetical protein EJB05_15752, partial [Eragrostis curvula]